MASSRLEKIGNIYTRVQGLLRSGAMKYEDRPLFFELYQAFPPLKQRKYMEEADANIKIRPIFYAEDQERASRDNSTMLFNLNEQTRATPSFTPRQPPPATPSKAPEDEPASNQKIFDFKELTDLKV